MLSTITVEIIIDPPKRFVTLGYSPKKIIPNIIPYKGCKGLMILADTVEKFLKL